MQSTRKKAYLAALELTPWQRREAPAQDPAELVSQPAQPVPPPAAADTGHAPAPAPAAAPRPAGDESAATSPPPVRATLQTAAALAPVPQDWAGLESAVSGCMLCKLCQTRTNTVFGVGMPASPLMIVGEGPGADEDAKGEPFVGRAGKLLDEMLKAIGRSRLESTPARAVYIANVVKCRPPGNRDPEPDEVSACRPYLDQQIRLIKPKLIVALGRVAAQRLLATDAPLSKLRGPVYEYGPERVPVLVTYHPAYLLRSPGEKAKSWQDLKRIAQFLKN